MGKGLEWIFFQKIYKNGQKAHKEILEALIIREIQINPTMRYHLTPTEM